MVWPSRFFNSIFKHKKALFLALFVFVVVGASLPQTVSANVFSDIVDAIRYAPIRVAAMIAVILIAIPAIVVTWVFKMIADLVYGVFVYVLSQMIQDPQNIWAITQNPVFLASWNIVKGYANMVIVVGLIAIAAATILQIREEYQAKKLLVPLIIVALLVNFSIVFVGLIIDGSNAVMKSFAVGGEAQGSIILAINAAHNNIADPLYAAAMSAAVSATDFTTPIGIGLTYAATEWAFAIIYICIAFTLFLITLVFIERYVMLAILFILSPLAFVLYIFPVTRSFFNDWWSRFLSWCFAGLIATFFLQLSVKVLATPNFNNFGTRQGDDLVTVMPRIIMQLAVVLGFLIAGYRFSKKSSIIANKVLDTTKKTARLAMGATMGVAGRTTGGLAKWTADNTGLTRAKDAVKYGTTRALEALPFTPVARGTAAANWKKQQEARLGDKSLQSKIDALSGAERAKIMESQDVFWNTAKGKEQRDMIFKAMQKDRQTGLLSKENRLYAMQNIARRENSTSVFSTDPDTAHLDNDKIKELKLKNPGKSLTELQNMARRDAFDRMDKKDIKDKNDTDLVKLAEEETAQGAAALEEAIKRNIVHKVKSGNVNAIGDLLTKAKSSYGSNAVKSAKKSDWQYAEFDEEAVKEIMEKKNPVTGVNFTEPEAKKQAKINEIKKLDSGKIRRDLPDNAITRELLDHLDVKIIGKLDEREGLSIEKKDKLRSLMSQLVIDATAAYALGTPAGDALGDELTLKADEIDAMT